jgi:hypothetical protein
VIEREDETAPACLLVVVDTGAGPAYEAAVERAAGVVVAARRTGARLRVVAGLPADAGGIGEPEAALDWLAGLGRAGVLTTAQLTEVRDAAGTGATVAVLSAPGSTAAAALVGELRRRGGPVVDLAESRG